MVVSCAFRTIPNNNRIPVNTTFFIIQRKIRYKTKKKPGLSAKKPGLSAKKPGLSAKKPGLSAKLTFSPVLC